MYDQESVIAVLQGQEGAAEGGGVFGNNDSHSWPFWN